MKDMARSIRRMHIARLKANRKVYWGYTRGRDGKMTTSQLGKVVHTPKPCSCYMCGNPRKLFLQKTLKEQAFDDIAKIVED